MLNANNNDAIKVTNTSNDVNSEGSLAWAIQQAADLPGLDAIDLSEISGQTIVGHSFVIGADNDIQFFGAGVTIDGNVEGITVFPGITIPNSGRLFTINGANVSFVDLNLVNGRHQGSSGTSGKGGNLGYGGAILINNDSSVIVDRVTFENNDAVGGNSSGRGGSGGRGGGVNADGNDGGDGSSGSGGDGGECSRILGVCTSGDRGSTGDSGSSGGFGAGGNSGSGGGGGE